MGGDKEEIGVGLGVGLGDGVPGGVEVGAGAGVGYGAGGHATQSGRGRRASAAAGRDPCRVGI